jgi:hypothetical protein
LDGQVEEAKNVDSLVTKREGRKNLYEARAYVRVTLDCVLRYRVGIVD